MGRIPLDSIMKKEIQLLQDLIDESRFTLVITGAGISVPAGIPTMQGLNFPKLCSFHLFNF